MNRGQDHLIITSEEYDTSIKGPAIIRKPVLNGRSGGIFELDANSESAALICHALIGAFFAVVGFVAYWVTADAEIIVPFMTFAVMAVVTGLLTQLPYGKTALERKLVKIHQPHEEVLSGRNLEITRKK